MRFLKACIRIYGNFVHFDLPDSVAPLKLQNKRYQAFVGAIGAMDGTHIEVKVSEREQRSFRNRKGQLSMNVLAIVNFDMLFLYTLAGREGSAHDGSVLEYAQSMDLMIPAEKFLLADAAYPLQHMRILTPYRGVRYHVQEWAHVGRNPKNFNELYNYRHAQLRNVVERTFGCLKQRFQILKKPLECKMLNNVRVFYACCVVHNFIRLRGKDREFEEGILSEDHITDNEEKNHMQTREGSEWRDSIANKLWNDKNN